MLKIKRIIVGEAATNCYLIWDDKSRQAIIVDPGDAADYIERTVADLSLYPTEVVLTHGHWDHTQAVLELMLAYKIPLAMDKADMFLVKRLKPPPTVSLFLKAGDSISVGKSKIKVIETPGHTPGSLSLLARQEKFVLVGDLCFAEGNFGGTDYYYSDESKLLKSLRRIRRLPPSARIYPGHGEAFKVSQVVID